MSYYDIETLLECLVVKPVCTHKQINSSGKLLGIYVYLHGRGK